MPWCFVANCTRSSYQEDRCCMSAMVRREAELALQKLADKAGSRQGAESEVTRSASSHSETSPLAAAKPIADRADAGSPVRQRHCGVVHIQVQVQKGGRPSSRMEKRPGPTGQRLCERLATDIAPHSVMCCFDSTRALCSVRSAAQVCTVHVHYAGGQQTGSLYCSTRRGVQWQRAADQVSE